MGIETSCDETAAAVVEDGAETLSNVVASQIDIHRRYGGVVPELASRQHLLAILPVVQQALEEAATTLEQLSAVAVTVGPGLAGSLLVGVNMAKALALAGGLPLVGVNHLEGHIYANWLVAIPPFPAVCLVVSGGHTDLVLMEGHGHYRRLGQTRDDAAGEAFDKVARLLELGYPGGPAIEAAARGVEPYPSFPRAWLKGTYDFSFSGLKTAVLRLVEKHGLGDESPSALSPARLAASFQESVVEVLVAKAVAAAARHRARCIVLAGGVAANSLLRRAMAEGSSIPVLCPPRDLCTDNAAMIAACGYFRLQAGQRHGWELDVRPNLRLGEPH